MLDFDKLRQLYEEETGYKLYHDYGEISDDVIAHRKRNEIVYPVFGMFRTTPVQLTPVRGSFVGVVTANITVLCRPEMIEEVRNKLNETAERLNGTTGQIDGYTYTYNMETCAVGEEIRDNILDYTVPIEQNITYSIVEGGVSSYSVQVWIDGFQLPALSVMQTRTRTTSMYSGEDMVGRVGVQMESFGLDITLPWISGGIVDVLRRECSHGSKNRAHAVVVDNNGDISAYLMICGNVVTSAQPPLNAGLTISLVEAAPETVRIPRWWKEHKPSGKVLLIPTAEMEEGTTILWGDGTGEVWDGDRILYHCYDMPDIATAYAIPPQKSADFIEIASGMEVFGKRIRVKATKNVSKMTDADMLKCEKGETFIEGGRLYMKNTENANAPIMFPLDKEMFDQSEGLGYLIEAGDIFSFICAGKVTQPGTLFEVDRNGV